MPSLSNLRVSEGSSIIFSRCSVLELKNGKTTSNCFPGSGLGENQKELKESGGGGSRDD